MKTNTSKKQWLIAALGYATLALTSHSNAAVIVTFAQVGNNVVATWNGSLDPGTFLSDATTGQTFSAGDGNSVNVLKPGAYDIWTGGASSPTSFNGGATTHTGGIFGFEHGIFIFNGADNGSPDTALIDFGAGSAFTMTKENNTLAAMGAASFNNTLAWTSSAGGTNTVSFTTVPEPSAALLGILGVVGLFTRRRRQA